MSQAGMPDEQILLLMTERARLLAITLIPLPLTSGLLFCLLLFHLLLPRSPLFCCLISLGLGCCCHPTAALQPVWASSHQLSSLSSVQSTPSPKRSCCGSHSYLFDCMTTMLIDEVRARLFFSSSRMTCRRINSGALN